MTTVLLLTVRYTSGEPEETSTLSILFCRLNRTAPFIPGLGAVELLEYLAWKFVLCTHKIISWKDWAALILRAVPGKNRQHTAWICGRHMTNCVRDHVLCRYLVIFTKSLNL